MVSHKHIFGEEALLEACMNALSEPGDDELSTTETFAAQAGIEAAAEYAAMIEKTDLAEMTEEEVAEFSHKLILGYRAALRKLVIEKIPF